MSTSATRHHPDSRRSISTGIAAIPLSNSGIFVCMIVIYFLLRMIRQREVPYARVVLLTWHQ